MYRNKSEADIMRDTFMSALMFLAGTTFNRVDDFNRVSDLALASKFSRAGKCSRLSETRTVSSAEDASQSMAIPSLGSHAHVESRAQVTLQYDRYIHGIRHNQLLADYEAA